MRRHPRFATCAIVTCLAFVCATTQHVFAQTAPPPESPPPAAAPPADGTPTPSPSPSPAPDGAYIPPPPPVAEPAPAASPSPAPQPAIVAPPTAPRDTRVTYKRRWGLFSAGLVLFLVGYGTDIGLTYGFGHQPSYTSAIPLVGPLIQLSESFGLDGPPVDSGDPSYDRRINNQIESGNSIARTLIYTGLAVNAVLQLGGMAMLICGLVVKKKVNKYATGNGGVQVDPAAGGFRITW